MPLLSLADENCGEEKPMTVRDLVSKLPASEFEPERIRLYLSMLVSRKCLQVF